MAACWRTIVQHADFDVHVVAFKAGKDTAFSDRMMEGIPCTLLDSEERADSAHVRSVVAMQEPNVVVLCGWFHPPYRRLVIELCGSPAFVLTMDTPWQETARQQAGRLVLRPFMHQMQKVVVTGERCWQYAQRLGVPAERIVRGLYGVDYTGLAPLWEQRQKDPWPRSFLFIGRYAEEKAIDVLVSAYARYRSLVRDPWPLHCCGKGPHASLLEAQPGIVNHGFVQPEALPEVWAGAGAFVLPSRFDPWPLALVEAASTGLPIVCTDACGSAVELVRDRYNGRIVPTENAAALADALVDLHHQSEELPAWGKRSQQFAAPYSAEAWAERWRYILQQVMDPRAASTPAAPRR